MKLGVATQLAFELAPYALVGTTVFTAALGAPALASLTGLLTLALLVDMALGECDPVVRLLGDAPRGAYEGKVVWITGASQGLGEALALHLASLGARLILSSRREGVLLKVCAACDALGAGESRPLVLDARGGAAAASKAAKAAREMATSMAGEDAGVDYLFHVAGGSQHAAAEDTTEEVDRDMFEINVMSAIALTKAVLPGMLARREGVITAVGSMAVKCPAPGQATYSATKAALSAFCHSLRGEVADRGVRVCVAHPGPIATGLDGQRRVVFGATLEKSTCDTDATSSAEASGASRRVPWFRETKSGWTRVGRRGASRRARRTGWTRWCSRSSPSCCCGTSCASRPRWASACSTRWGRNARAPRAAARACTTSRRSNLGREVGAAEASRGRPRGCVPVRRRRRASVVFVFRDASWSTRSDAIVTKTHRLPPLSHLL
jgi:dehydrogenase/reductase SDR family protein 7